MSRQESALGSRVWLDRGQCPELSLSIDAGCGERCGVEEGVQRDWECQMVEGGVMGARVGTCQPPTVVMRWWSRRKLIGDVPIVMADEDPIYRTIRWLQVGVAIRVRCT